MQHISNNLWFPTPSVTIYSVTDLDYHELPGNLNSATGWTALVRIVSLNVLGKISSLRWWATYLEQNPWFPIPSATIYIVTDFNSSELLGRLNAATVTKTHSWEQSF